MSKSRGITTAEISSIIDKKCEELKVNILADITAEITRVGNNEKINISELFEKKKSELVNDVEIKHSIQSVRDQVKKVLEDNRALNRRKKIRTL